MSMSASELGRFKEMERKVAELEKIVAQWTAPPPPKQKLSIPTQGRSQSGY